jgi:hypothetical protein
LDKGARVLPMAIRYANDARYLANHARSEVSA